MGLKTKQALGTQFGVVGLSSEHGKIMRAIHADCEMGISIASHMQHAVNVDAPATCAIPDHHIPRINKLHG